MAERRFFTIKKKDTLLLMWLVLLLSGFYVATAKADSNDEYSPQNIDVIYVIDGSGSMLHSDPENLALTAGKLFTDLCGSSDRDTRAGYVFYSHNIDSSAGLTSLQEPGNKERLQNELMGLTYERENDTDIALGLTNGVQLLKEGNAFDGSRNPMIILLSDGMTDLPKGPRTVEESQEELKHTIDEAKTLGLPVYTIGLNFNQNVDVSTMQGIADATGAKYYETNSAADLNGIVRDIFNDHTEGVMDSLQPHYDPDTGRFYTSFIVEDESIYLVNIVILTSYGVSDPILTGPEDNYIDIEQNDRISVSSDETYMTIKILYPTKGEWKLSVSGDANDAIDISMLSTRDLNFSVELDLDSIMIGETLGINANLRRMDEIIHDPDLLTGTKALISVIGVSGNELLNGQEMSYDSQTTSFHVDVIPQAPDTYNVTAQLISERGDFSVNAPEMSFTANAVPITLKDQTNEIDVKFNPFETNKSINLDTYFEYDPTAEISCTFSGDDMTSPAQYNAETMEIKLTKGKNKRFDITASVQDQYGSASELVIHVTIQSIVIPIICAGIAILVIIIAIILIHRARRPKLEKPISIELQLDDQFINDTPAAASLIMPTGKTAITLQGLLMENSMAASSYSQAFARSGLQPLVDKIVLQAVKDGSSKVLIQKGITGKVIVDYVDADLSKDISKTLREGDSIYIQYDDGNSVNAIRLFIPSEHYDAESPFPDGSGRSGLDAFGRGNDFGSGSPFGSGSGASTGGDPFGSFRGSESADTNPFGSSEAGSRGKTDNPFGSFQ